MINIERSGQKKTLEELEYEMYRNLDTLARAINQSEEPWWNNLGYSATAIKSTGLGSAPTWDNTNMGWSFSASATNTLEVVVQLDHGFDEVNGQTVSPVLFWTPVNTNAGNVRFQLEWRWFNPNEVMPAFESVFLTQAAAGVSNQLTLAAFPSVVKSGLYARIDSVVELKFSRLGADGADTHTGEIILKWAGLHVRRNDGRGSVLETAKG